MPRQYSSRHIVIVLERNDFLFISQKGSHAKYRKYTEGKVYTAIVPMGKREVPYGTFQSIVKQSGLSEAQFR